MTHTMRQATIRVVAASVLLGTALRSSGQDVEFIALTRVQHYAQFGPLTVGLKDPEFFDENNAPFHVEIFADTPDTALVDSAVLTIPGGASVPLQPDPDDGSWAYFIEFESFPEMAAASPDGSYRLDLETTNDGPQSVELDLPLAGFRGITNFTVFAGAQAIDPGSPFTFRWNPIPGGSADDVVILEIDGDSDDTLESPDIGEPGQLTGLSTEYTIPGGSLPPGQEFTASLLVFRIVDTDDGYPGAFTVSALGKTLSMPIRTTGGSDGESPTLEYSSPFPGEIGVETNSQVVFTFDERMDSSVDPADAITWTGLPDPSFFSYTWSANGRRLFCKYGPGLPTGATVQWTLNPTGSAAKLRDEAGNVLPNEVMSDFTTSQVSNTGDPDVVLVQLGKVKSFFQDGPTAADQGTYFAGFFAELSGIGTVTQLDLGIPTRGVAANVGEYFFDFRELENEAGFAEAGDLNRIFPSGDYDLVFQTAHDGEKTIQLTVGADDYPNAPTVRDFATTQAIDGSQPFTLSWDPMTGGTSGDFIELFIEGETACYFESPFVGEPGALDGTATGITIPAGTLPPGRTLECELVFARVADTDETSYPGATGFAFFASITEFEIRTLGDPHVPQLAVSHDGTQATVTVTAEIGHLYEVRASDDLRNWWPAWTEFIGDDCDGFLGSFDFVDHPIGVPQRFYQVEQIPLPE